MFAGREAALARLTAVLDDTAAGDSLTWWVAAEDGDQVQAGLAGRLCPPVALAGSTVDAAARAAGWLQSHEGGCWSWTT